MYDLISDSYRELNRRLHAKGNYGAMGSRWSGQVTSLLAEGGYVSILDYGCGQGSLKNALGDPAAMQEYDPAVSGKDLLPQPAELVVCTDVLEHIEPDKIDNVLDHLRTLTRRTIFMVIATRPATKHLADGRNAHLLIESPEWWREKIEQRFKIESFAENKRNGKTQEIVVVASTRLKLGSIHSHSAVPDDLRYQQARLNITKTDRRIKDQRQKRDVGHVILCAYGPGLAKDYDNILAEKEAFMGSVVVSVSGAHDFLIERGIIPDYHVEVDPREHKAFFTKNSHPDVKYLIASCCHPVLVDQLLGAGRDVTLFHVYNGPRDMEIIEELEPDCGLLAGGGSVGLRAFNLFYAMGYRSFSLRGMDSSYDKDHGGQHAGPHTGKVHSEIQVQCNGRWFTSSYIMIAYARYFLSNYRNLSQISQLKGEEPLNEHGDYVHVVIHGDGLLSEMAKESMKPAKTEAA